MKRHYFIGQKKSPFHLSVGAVLMNAKKQIYVHHLRNVLGKTDLYFLMRETVEPGESLESALARGLKQEFGVRGKIRGYLGSLTSSFTNWQKAKVQKTTLYFLCSPVGMPGKGGKAESHLRARGVREWRPIRFLIPQMKKQARILKRSDFDESEILKRIK